jgi:hypothetical protein
MKITKIMASGALVDLADLWPSDVNLTDVARGLGVPRFGGQAQFPDGNPYTVAQHCLVLAEWYERHGAYDPLFADEALLHDAAEAYVGDMHGPLKHLPKLAEFSAIEDRLLAAIHERVGHSVSSAHRDLVSRFDKCLLVNEFALFWPGLRGQHPELPCFKWEPLQGVRIEPMTPAEASAKWLHRAVDVARRNGAQP